MLTFMKLAQLSQIAKGSSFLSREELLRYLELSDNAWGLYDNQVTYRVSDEGLLYFDNSSTFFNFAQRLVKHGHLICKLGLVIGKLELTNMSSLKGAPEVVDGTCEISSQSLTSLVGIPKTVSKGMFIDMPHLASLAGAGSYQFFNVTAGRSLKSYAGLHHDLSSTNLNFQHCLGLSTTDGLKGVTAASCTLSDSTTMITEVPARCSLYAVPLCAHLSKLMLTAGLSAIDIRFDPKTAKRCANVEATLNQVMAQWSSPRQRYLAAQQRFIEMDLNYLA